MPDRAIGQRSQQFVLFLPHNENDVPPIILQNGHRHKSALKLSLSSNGARY